MNRRILLWTLPLLLLLVLVIGYLGKLHRDWLDSMENAEHVRLSRVLGMNAWLLKETLDGEMISLARGLQVPGGSRLDIAEAVEARSDAWRRQSRWPRLLQDVLLISQGAEGSISIQRLDGAAGRLEALAAAPELRPLRDRVETLLDAGPGHLSPRRGAALNVVTETPAVLVETRIADPGQIRPAWLAVRMNHDYLWQELLPELVATFFPPPNYEGIQVAVVNSFSGRLAYSTLAIDSADAFGRIDFAYGLLDAGTDGSEIPYGMSRAARGREAMPNSENPPTEADHLWFRNFWARTFYSGHWQLLVRRDGVSFADQVQAERLSSARLSFGLLALIGILAVVLVVQARRAQELARQKIEFVAGISHELRTPLAVLSAAGDNLADSLVDDEAQLEEYGQIIQDQTQRLREMVENVLHLARRRSSTPELVLQPVNVGPLVQEIVERSRRQFEAARFDVETAIQAGSLPVLGNSRALQAAVLNLISNALKYGQPARWLRVSVARVEEQGNEEVRIAIEDRGPGIPPADAERLFDPFYRGARARSEQIEGSGLGLAVVRDVAEAHRGRVSIAPRPEGGSAFALHLPLLEAA